MYFGEHLYMRTLWDACHGVAWPPSACNPGHYSNFESSNEILLMHNYSADL